MTENLVIKMTSRRTGKVAWLRKDGTPSDYRSEAGYFSDDEANTMIDDYESTLIRVTGTCHMTFQVLDRSAR